MAATATAAPSALKITATQGILAMKGSGKTYRAMAQAEEFLERGAHIVAIDPTGAWWGLRYAADNPQRVMYATIALLGGDHGSVDLQDSHGALVAKAVVEKKLSCVLDLSRMSKAGMRRFVAAFLLELFRTNPNRQIHLFIDEADLFAPQHAQGEAATVAGAMSDVVRRGRKKGIGVTMISQRPQALSTDVRNQCDVMTLLRVKGTHDLDAIEDWLDSNGFDAGAIRKSLPTLQPGDYFLCGDDTMALLNPRERTHRKSYDSGRTPEEGDESVGHAEPFDPETLKAWLGDAAEEIAKNDPKAQADRIEELEAELAELEAQPARAGHEETQALQSALDLTKDELAATAEKRDYWLRIAQELTQKFQLPYLALMEQFEEIVEEYHAAEAEKWKPIAELCKDPEFSADPPWHPTPANTPQLKGRNGTGKSTLNVVNTGNETLTFSRDQDAPRMIIGEDMDLVLGKKLPQGIVNSISSGPPLPPNFSKISNGGRRRMLGKCAQTIVNTLGTYGARSRDALAVLSGYSATSGGFGGALADLREQELIADGENGIELTRAGCNAATTNAGLPKGKELLEHWKREVGKCGAAILDALKKHGALARIQIATATRYSETSGGFGGALATLRKLKLIEDTKRGIELCAELR